MLILFARLYLLHNCLTESFASIVLLPDTWLISMPIKYQILIADASDQRRLLHGQIVNDVAGRLLRVTVIQRYRATLCTVVLRVAGAAALLYTLRVPQGIIYSGGFLLGIKAFSAAVLGGIGNLRGALLGGLILGVMENYGQALFGTQWRDVVAFVLLVLVLLVRPTGILGESLGKARA